MRKVRLGFVVGGGARRHSGRPETSDDMEAAAPDPAQARAAAGRAVDVGRGRPGPMAEGGAVRRQDRAFPDPVAGGENRLRALRGEARRIHRVPRALARSVRAGVPARMGGGGRTRSRSFAPSLPGASISPASMSLEAERTVRCFAVRRRGAPILAGRSSGRREIAGRFGFAALPAEEAWAEVLRRPPAERPDLPQAAVVR